MQTELHQAELISEALASYGRAEIALSMAPTADNTFAMIRATNVLFDRCLQAGMPYDEASPAEWAALHELKVLG